LGLLIPAIAAFAAFSSFSCGRYPALADELRTLLVVTEGRRP
jgi:hypothetical protein